MKPLRWLAGSLLWIVAGLLGLVGALLSITVILLPLGIPLLMLARRVFTVSARLVVPRSARHPLDEADNAVKRRGKKLDKAAKAGRKDIGRKGRKAMKKARASLPSPVEAAAPRSRRGLLDRVGIRGR
jgi:hypothetical protein